MVWIVIIINLMLGTSLLWLAWRVYLAQATIAKATASIHNYAIASQKGLNPAPIATMQAQSATEKIRVKIRVNVREGVRSRYQTLQIQLAQARSLFNGFKVFFRWYRSQN